MTYLDKFVLECHNTIFEDNKECREALNYLTTRHITKNSIVFHKLGYCPYKFNIPTEIKEYGQDHSSVKKLDYSFRIRGRLIVPVYSEFGEIVGLATRRPSFEAGFSWWNLPFPKGNYLFMLDKARKYIFNDNEVFIVEGYMDALILWQAGLKTVVGLMGTKLNLRKIGLIARYCDNICVSLDSDQNESGQKARDKSISILHKFGFENISEITLPLKDGQKSADPSDFVAEQGLEEYKKLRKTLNISAIQKICRSEKNAES